jgi:hypothetical protein
MVPLGAGLIWLLALVGIGLIALKGSCEEREARLNREGVNTGRPASWPSSLHQSAERFPGMPRRGAARRWARGGSG